MHAAVMPVQSLLFAGKVVSMEVLYLTVYKIKAIRSLKIQVLSKTIEGLSWPHGEALQYQRIGHRYYVYLSTGLQ